MARFGGLAVATAMAMPETTVNKYHLETCGKSNVGPSREVPTMEAVAIPEPMQELTDDPFGAVFFDPTDCMIRLRCSAVRVSATVTVQIGTAGQTGCHGEPGLYQRRSGESPAGTR